MSPTKVENVKTVYVNEKPELPAENDHIKYEVKEVSRTVETVEGKTTSIKYVLNAIAKTIPGMVEIAEGKEADALGYFNAGYFASLRVKASNELAGGTDEDRAFARVVKAVAKLPLFAGKNEEEITTTLRDNPALMALFAGKN